jgi:hypothetical protein
VECWPLARTPPPGVPASGGGSLWGNVIWQRSAAATSTSAPASTSPPPAPASPSPVRHARSFLKVGQRSLENPTGALLGKRAARAPHRLLLHEHGLLRGNHPGAHSHPAASHPGRNLRLHSVNPAEFSSDTAFEHHHTSSEKLYGYDIVHTNPLFLEQNFENNETTCFWNIYCIKQSFTNLT